MQVCPRCGDENSDRARFCQRCGGALDALAGSREVRKTVTVLFMDVVGSTEMGERQDPESTRRVMSRLFEVVRPVLEHHGGTVEKFIGDAVMAVFGIPEVHEDDALRACRAALEIQVEIGRLNKELERDWGITISTRTGIYTGDVIAGDPSSGQTLVTGDPVNTAARLEQSAPPGSILIGTPTYRRVSDAVDVEPVEPVTAKGKAVPVAAYRLVSIAPLVPTRMPRLDSPMVGRERELGLLLEAFDRSVTEARCVLATVLGMPGVGKSRLVHEFVASTADRATVLRGRCLPYGEGITFWPVVNIVHEAAGITEGDSPEGARAKIEALLPEGDDRVVLRDRVAAAVGLGEATWAIQETFWAIRKLLESVASHRPLVVVFDDIHWGEPAFLDLVEYLEGWSSASAIVLLCIARPELLQTRSGWASAATESTIITLNRLDGEESDRLIQNLLGPSAVPDGFRRRIAETAEGNPLFVEEMLGMLIDEERLRWEEGLWVVVEEGSAVPIPPNIQALLAARIEQLPEAEREIMQTASVVGKIFWWGAVADLSSAGDRTQIGSQLQDLVRKGMIRPGPSALAGQDAFRFHHILIRDAAYDSVPRGSRADLHERVAAWIERAVGERIEEYEEIVGYHLEQACHHGVVSPTASDLELAAKASRMLASAGRRALDRDDVNAALNLLTRAARLSSADDREALEVRRLLAQALEEAGDLQQTDGVLSDLVGRARAIGDQRAEWRARIMRAWLVAGTTTVPTDEVKRIATRAIEVFGQLGDERGLSSSWSFIAWLAFNAGRIGEAEKATAKSVLHARAAGDTALEMDQLASSAQHAANGQMPVEDALAVCRKMLHQVTGYPSHESTVRTSLGTLEAMRGNFDAAREDIQHARVVCRDLGNTHQLASMTAYAGFVEWYAGDIEAEARERQAGYDAFAGMGAGGYVATWAAWLARPLIHLGREDEAFELTRESERLAAEDDVTAQVPSREARATILARRGQMEDAEKLARTAVTIAERTDWLNLQGDAQTTLAEVLWLAGRSDEAADAAQRALDRYEGKGNIVAAGWARTLLEDLRVG